MYIISLATLAVVVGVAAIVLWKLHGAGAGQNNDRVPVLEEELTALRERLDQANQGRVQMETLHEGSLATIKELRTEIGELHQRREEAVTARHRSEQDLAAMRQQLQEIEKRVADWETAKKESIEAAKAAALASSRELSAQLMAEHKRENEAAKKDQEERVQEATTELQQNFETMVKNVHSLSQDVAHNRGSVETVMRALTSPGGAGHFAEIGLENTLKSFGLQAGRDFVMQHTTLGEDGGRLRPDAIVFLPGDAALVIDSKASKFFLELAETEGTDAEDEAYSGLARTMAQHLRDLTNKDYASAIRDSYRNAGRGDEFRKITTAMYLPSEAAIERLDIADPEFSRKASAGRIIPVGPSGLRGLIGLASVNIDLGRQAENQEKIVDATRALLDSVLVALGHAERVGNSLESAAKNFAKFTSSINSRLLPRSRGLVELGVRPNKHKGQIQNLAAFEVTTFDAATFIEGDVTTDTEENDDVVPPPLGVGHSEQE
ncbi:MAG: DNA recombination protein RmuC [Rhodospirillaceae bacterium]|nr:DNA recombination protein RmuC [Rhodospirillaceae bacterium]MBT7615094.1 DNA recombination protein RmuC [Rhodospirillaceae bacterium]